MSVLRLVAINFVLLCMHTGYYIYSAVYIHVRDATIYRYNLLSSYRDTLGSVTISIHI